MKPSVVRRGAVARYALLVERTRNDVIGLVPVVTAIALIAQVRGKNQLASPANERMGFITKDGWEKLSLFSHPSLAYLSFL